MNVKCLLQEKVSKNGNAYMCLYVPDIEKTIFLEPAEVKLLSILYKKDFKDKDTI